MTQPAEVLWVARYDYHEGWKMNIPHEHDYYQILYIIDGTGVYMLENVENPVIPGRLFLIRPFRKHQLLKVTKTSMKTYDIKFSINDPQLAALLDEAKPVLDLADHEIQGLFKKIREEGLKKYSYYKEFSHFYLMQLLYMILRQNKLGAEVVDLVEETAAVSDESRICKLVTDYIKKNYQEELTLKQIADSLGYNQSYICQVFKNNVKTTPIRYLYTFRILKAKELITYSDYNLKQIALMTGFKTIHHFTRLFHNIEGVTPGQWRDREKEGIRKGVFINETFKNQNIIHSASK